MRQDNPFASAEHKAYLERREKKLESLLSKIRVLKNEPEYDNLPQRFRDNTEDLENWTKIQLL